MKQSRSASLIEAVISTAAGFGLSVAAQAIFLPLMGVPMPIGVNLAFAVIMTVISIARRFSLRRLFEALHIRVPLSAFALAVIAERRRQVDAEGFDAAHDDAHRDGELGYAGGAYALAAGVPPTTPPPACFPWPVEWWKPHGVRRDLVRAAALVIAEGERFDRLRKQSRSGHERNA